VKWDRSPEIWEAFHGSPDTPSKSPATDLTSASRKARTCSDGEFTSPRSPRRPTSTPSARARARSTAVPSTETKLARGARGASSYASASWASSSSRARRSRIFLADITAWWPIQKTTLCWRATSNTPSMQFCTDIRLLY